FTYPSGNTTVQRVGRMVSMLYTPATSFYHSIIEWVPQWLVLRELLQEHPNILIVMRAAQLQLYNSTLKHIVGVEPAHMNLLVLDWQHRNTLFLAQALYQLYNSTLKHIVGVEPAHMNLLVLDWQHRNTLFLAQALYQPVYRCCGRATPTIWRFLRRNFFLPPDGLPIFEPETFRLRRTSPLSYQDITDLLSQREEQQSQHPRRLDVLKPGPVPSLAETFGMTTGLNWVTILVRRPGNLSRNLEESVYERVEGWMRKEFGERRVVVFDGSLRLMEARALFRRAALLVGTHGAALTNLLFMPRGAFLLEIRPRGYPNACYHHLASVSQMHYWLLLGNGTKDSALQVDTGEVLSTIREVAGKVFAALRGEPKDVGERLGERAKGGEEGTEKKTKEGSIAGVKIGGKEIGSSGGAAANKSALLSPTSCSNLPQFGRMLRSALSEAPVKGGLQAAGDARWRRWVGGEAEWRMGGTLFVPLTHQTTNVAHFLGKAAHILLVNNVTVKSGLPRVDRFLLPRADWTVHRMKEHGPHGWLPSMLHLLLRMALEPLLPTSLLPSLLASISPSSLLSPGPLAGGRVEFEGQLNAASDERPMCFQTLVVPGFLKGEFEGQLNAASDERPMCFQTLVVPGFLKVRLSSLIKAITFNGMAEEAELVRQRLREVFLFSPLPRIPTLTFLHLNCPLPLPIPPGHHIQWHGGGGRAGEAATERGVSLFTSPPHSNSDLPAPNCPLPLPIPPGHHIQWHGGGGRAGEAAIERGCLLPLPSFNYPLYLTNSPHLSLPLQAITFNGMAEEAEVVRQRLREVFLTPDGQPVPDIMAASSGGGGSAAAVCDAQRHHDDWEEGHARSDF
ncbi:unnamed protein product, partial [Closterium sp. NIES-65]